MRLCRPRRLRHLRHEVYRAKPEGRPASGRRQCFPIYGITIPVGYRDWQMIAVAQLVTDKIDQLRAQLGNEIAIKAYKEGKIPVPGWYDYCRATLESLAVGGQQ